jgi:hypothetical protein
MNAMLEINVEVKSAVAKRARSRVLARAVSLELMRDKFGLDIEIMTVDRVLWRWAASVGTNLPETDWDDVPRVRLPPLDDASAIVVDQAILRAPIRAKTLVLLWYKGNGASTVMCQKLGLESRAALYTLWRATLWHFRAALLESECPELRQMIL